MLYSILKPLLFSLDPEEAHNLTLKIAHLSPALGKLTGSLPDARLRTSVGKTKWLSPVGLAAGLDKNGDALPFFSQQGFGALEIGTVTLKAQEGNPKPRLFRYPEEENLRNAMGFPNQGLLKLLPKLERFEGSIPVGVNMGKNKLSDKAESIDELSIILSTLLHEADYFVVNVSSPNTPGLRDFQERSYLAELFKELNSQRQDKDLYLKIAPDIDSDKLSELIKIAADFNLTGLIATNTTIMPERGVGGVSGRILRSKSRAICQQILKEKPSSLELISVGGFSSAFDVFKYWSDGGKALQLYTAYVYQGADLLKKINAEILEFLKQNQLKDLEEFFSLTMSQRQKIIPDN